MSATAAPAIQEQILQKRTLWRDAMRSFFKNRLAVSGLVVVAIFIFMAIFADIIAPAPYYKSVLSDNLRWPSFQHWFGTDMVGRDYLSRIIYGARTSLLVGFSVQAFAFAIGLPWARWPDCAEAGSISSSPACWR